MISVITLAVVGSISFLSISRYSADTISGVSTITHGWDVSTSPTRFTLASNTIREDKAIHLADYEKQYTYPYTGPTFLTAAKTVFAPGNQDDFFLIYSGKSKSNASRNTMEIYYYSGATATKVAIGNTILNGTGVTNQFTLVSAKVGKDNLLYVLVKETAGAETFRLYKFDALGKLKEKINFSAPAVLDFFLDSSSVPNIYYSIWNHTTANSNWELYQLDGTGAGQLKIRFYGTQESLIGVSGNLFYTYGGFYSNNSVNFYSYDLSKAAPVPTGIRVNLGSNFTSAYNVSLDLGGSPVHIASFDGDAHTVYLFNQLSKRVDAYNLATSQPGGTIFVGANFTGGPTISSAGKVYLLKIDDYGTAKTSLQILPLNMPVIPSSGEVDLAGYDSGIANASWKEIYLGLNLRQIGVSGKITLCAGATLSSVQAPFDKCTKASLDLPSGALYSSSVPYTLPSALSGRYVSMIVKLSTANNIATPVLSHVGVGYQKPTVVAVIEPPTTGDQDQNGTAQISSVSRSSLSVLIKGSGFGSTKGTVKINGATVNSKYISSWSNTQVKVSYSYLKAITGKWEIKTSTGQIATYSK